MDILEKKNTNKYLLFYQAELHSTDEKKEILKNYTELWDGIKNEIETINGGKIGEYDKDFMKIKFSSDDDLLQNNPLKFPTMTVVVRSVFEENDKYYPQVYLDECFYGFLMLEYDRIDFSEEIDINKRSGSKECVICYDWYLTLLVLSMSHIFSMVVMI